MLNYETVESLIEKSFFRSEYFYDSYCKIIKGRIEREDDFEWLEPKTIIEMLFYPREIDSNNIEEKIKNEFESLNLLLYFNKNSQTLTFSLLRVLAEVYAMKKVYAGVRYSGINRRSSPIIYQMD